MITFISEKLASYLCRKQIIEERKKEIYQYGYEVFISGLIGFVIAGIIGAFMHRFFDALIFLAVFVPVRRFCGGYHADSYLKCNTIFTLIFLTVMIISQIMQRIISFMYLIILLLIYMWAIIEYAPMENSGKPMDDEQKARNRKISLAVSVFLCVVSAISYAVSQRIAILIATTLFCIAFLMFAEKYKISKKNRKSDHT
ncbi:accessory gene regulator ArgB-like protein [Porcipelethomonas sp.]|uniref:accessory gene regulator ArgB-like protein n=1 Tax=Porcipelethomonas sp. TaxID=2981675 RepID=UPI003EF2820E